ncbi:MAG: helix-turn-helix domain-containing protein [Promethearchaeota archaeon]|nr:MAG: helix-turn-helix domain-containing protein [Candidatus Lokiarchaeota archaeon]
MIYNILHDIESIFKKQNFELLTFHHAENKKSKFCFDFLVKKSNLFYLVKVFPNIDNLNESVIENIKVLCQLLNCKPILIGIKNRYHNLEDNTIYIRDDLPFISVKTLFKILNDDIYPYYLSRKGGKVVFLNGDLMKTLREQKNISRRKLSEKLGVTKRTLCSYENENLRPSQEIAEELLDTLQEKTIFKKINVFEWHFELDFENKDFIKTRELTDFESHLQEIFKDIGITTIWYKRGQVPFEFSICSKDFFLKSDSEFYPLFSGLSQENAKINKLNLEYLRSFANMVHKNALFIVNNDFKIPSIFKRVKLPVIKVKNLEQVDNEEDFKEIVHEN